MTPGCQRPTVGTERERGRVPTPCTNPVYQPGAQRLPSHKGALREPAQERGALTTPISSAPTGNFPRAQVSRGGLSGREKEGEGRRPAQNFTRMFKTVSCSRTRKQTAKTKERPTNKHMDTNPPRKLRVYDCFCKHRNCLVDSHWAFF